MRPRKLRIENYTSNRETKDFIVEHRAGCNFSARLLYQKEEFDISAKRHREWGRRERSRSFCIQKARVTS